MKAVQHDAKNSQKLHKVLAHAGLGSRRDMEGLIASGQVVVNGRKAVIGARVVSGDVIKVGSRVVDVGGSELPRVLLYHKPEGEIVSRDDPENRPSVFTNLPPVKGAKWLSVGRLDYTTSGLLIFTTSGDFANRLAHPRFQLEREYQVRVLGRLSPDQTRQLTSGITLSDGEARFESLVERGGTGSNHWYQVIVKEGKNRIVRRMFEELGFTVSRLIRSRFGSLRLPENLKKGQWQELDQQQVKQLLKSLDLLPPGTNSEKPKIRTGPSQRKTPQSVTKPDRIKASGKNRTRGQPEKISVRKNRVRDKLQ